MNPKRHGVTYDKWLGNKKKQSHWEQLRGAIDDVLAKQPDGFDAFLQMLNEIGYTAVRHGRNLSFRFPDCKSSIRMNSLGEGYTESEIRAVLDREGQHTPKKKQDPLTLQKDYLTQSLCPQKESAADSTPCPSSGIPPSSDLQYSAMQDISTASGTSIPERIIKKSVSKLPPRP